MSRPLKPEVCILDGKLAIFMGADYKLLPLADADRLVRKMQGELARMKRAEKRRLRDERRSTCTSEK